MAKYRSIHEKIWKDPDFQAYNPEGKLVFIYLCTNESTSESGIYAITPRTIANETGIKLESVAKILESLKNVIFDTGTNYVYVRRFKLYNGGGRSDLVSRSIVAEFQLSSISPLWSAFIKDYPEYKEAILAAGKPLAVSLPPTPPNVTISNSISISNSKDRLGNLSPTVSQPLASDFEIPDFMDKKTWNDFLAMRVKIKKPATENAKILLVKKLTELKSLGNDPTKVLERSIVNNWQDVFALPENHGNGGKSNVTSRPLAVQPKGSDYKQSAARAAGSGNG
jgi:hypothetical protein